MRPSSQASNLRGLCIRRVGGREGNNATYTMAYKNEQTNVDWNTCYAHGLWLMPK